LQERNLNVSTEAFLSVETAFAFADLYVTLGNINTLTWLTPHAAVACEHGRVSYAWEQLDYESWDNELCTFTFSAEGKDIVALARPLDSPVMTAPLARHRIHLHVLALKYSTSCSKYY
jgi:hypothetical protein